MLLLKGSLRIVWVIKHFHMIFHKVHHHHVFRILRHWPKVRLMFMLMADQPAELMIRIRAALKLRQVQAKHILMDE
jgi:hypothetical protein